MKDAIHAYAVIRIDKWSNKTIAELSHEDLNILITIKEIVPTIEMAEEEVNRLNKLNEQKDLHYFWQTTRIKRRDISILSSLI